MGPFQTEILEGKIAQAPTHNTHVMVTPIGHAELKWDGGTSVIPQNTSAACAHYTHCWLQTNINSGEECDWIKPYSLKREHKWHMLYL